MLLAGLCALAPGTSTVVVVGLDGVANEATVAGRKPAAQDRVEVGCWVAAALVHMSAAAGPASGGMERLRWVDPSLTSRYPQL